MATDLTLKFANFAPVNVWNFAPVLCYTNFCSLKYFEHCSINKSVKLTLEVNSITEYKDRTKESQIKKKEISYVAIK